MWCRVVGLVCVVCVRSCGLLSYYISCSVRVCLCVVVCWLLSITSLLEIMIECDLDAKFAVVLTKNIINYILVMLTLLHIPNKINTTYKTLSRLERRNVQLATFLQV